MLTTEREILARDIVVHPDQEPPHLVQLLADILEALRAERVRTAAWEQTAAQNQRNADFYRDLLDQVADHLGPDVFRANDGSLADCPLRLKIPDMVGAMAVKLAWVPTYFRGVVLALESQEFDSVQRAIGIANKALKELPDV
jgi:hypothetical protein